MRNLDRVVQHLNNLKDENKAERVAAFVRALERRNKRIQKTARWLHAQRPMGTHDVSGGGN